MKVRTRIVAGTIPTKPLFLRRLADSGEKYAKEALWEAASGGLVSNGKEGVKDVAVDKAMEGYSRRVAQKVDETKGGRATANLWEGRHSEVEEAKAKENVPPRKKASWKALLALIELMRGESHGVGEMDPDSVERRLFLEEFAKWCRKAGIFEWSPEKNVEE